MPKVSVIIPTYNRAHFIKDAIDSVLAQTYKDYEIIIVDDGSTDNTVEVIKKYSDKVKYFFQENKGISVARNSGIRESKGELIAFLDSDDIWFPQKLEYQVKVIHETGADLVHSMRYHIDMVQKIKPVLTPLLPARSSEDFLSGKTHISMTVLVRKGMLLKAGLFPGKLKSTEDTELWLRIAQLGKIAFIEEPLMNYRFHGSNISASMENKLNDRIVIYNQMMQVKDKRVIKPIWRKKLAVCYYQLSREKYTQEKYSQGLRFVLKAVLTNAFVGTFNIHPSIGWVAIKSNDALYIRVKKFFVPYKFILKCLMKGLGYGKA